SGGKVADNAQLGGEAELAIDGAADLAGDAEGGVEIAVGLAAVAELAEIAFGHPDGFDGLAVACVNEVTFGSVDGLKGVGNRGQANGVAGLGEALAKRFREGGQLIKGLDPLAVEGVGKLPGAERGDRKLLKHGCKLFIIKAK